MSLEMLSALFHFAWPTGEAARDPEQKTVETVEEHVVEEYGDEVAEILLRERRLLREKNETLKTKLKQVEAQLEERPPIWIPDSERQCCMSCSSTFSLFNRKHHCRSCGEIFDGKCSSNSIELQFYPKAGMLRVCDSCFEQRVENIGSCDLDSTALLALGYGEKVVPDESVVLIESPIKKSRVIKKVTIVHGEKQSSVVHKMGDGKRKRSEIPPPPPFPTILPKGFGATTSKIASNLPMAHSKAKAFVPPTTNMKRLDMQELQQGIANLKKTPKTPGKVLQAKSDEGLSDLRNSLRRRRRALEDSVVSFTNEVAYSPQASENQENTPLSKAPLVAKATKSLSLIDGLRDKVVYKESPIPLVNSTNNSWIE